MEFSERLVALDRGACLKALRALLRQLASKSGNMGLHRHKTDIFAGETRFVAAELPEGLYLG